MTEKKEYIEREATLRNLADDLPYKGSVKRVIMQAPAADVVEVRHGEWSRKRTMRHDGKQYCTYCDAEFVDNIPCDTFDYCPICGAKMDGERKETK